MKTQLKLYSLDQLKNDTYYWCVYNGIYTTDIGNMGQKGKVWKKSGQDDLDKNLIGFIEEITFLPPEK